MYKKTWWLNPIGVYAIIMVLVLLAFLTTEQQYNDVYNMQKGINGAFLLLYFASFILFAFGYWASKRFRIKGKSFSCMSDEQINIESVYHVFKILTTICILAYVIWYVNFLRINGVTILSSFTSFSNLSKVIFDLRDNSGRIPGLTTFTEIGIISVPIGVYLLYKYNNPEVKKRIRRDLIIVFALATFRALAFSERLAIIELLLPVVIVILSMTKRGKMRPLVRLAPILAVILLLLIFAVFEYSRSWLTHYINYYDSYFEFIVQRLAGYYTNGINTECLYIQHASTSILPYRTIEWLWDIPGISQIYNAITPYNVTEEFIHVLHTYGNPEYNNPGGILTFFIDFGVFFPFVQIIFGFFVGRVYRLFLNNNIFCMIFYAFIYVALLELPRRFALGDSVAPIVFIGMFIFYYICSKRSIRKISVTFKTTQ